MIDKILSLNPIIQTFIATLFTWGITTIGSSLVFLLKKVNKNIMDGMLGFAGGVMIAASFFSLITPAIDMSNKLNLVTWLVLFIGFFSGGLLLFIGDKIYDYFDNKNIKEKSKKNSLKKMLYVNKFNNTS